MLQILERVPDQRGIDPGVGCGTGWLTERLVHFGPTTAIDLSPRAIEIGEETGPGCEVLGRRCYTQEFSTGKFDVVICVDTISNVPDQLRFVERLAHGDPPQWAT